MSIKGNPSVNIADLLDAKSLERRICRVRVEPGLELGEQFTGDRGDVFGRLPLGAGGVWLRRRRRLVGIWPGSRLGRCCRRDDTGQS